MKRKDILMGIKQWKQQYKQQLSAPKRTWQNRSFKEKIMGLIFLVPSLLGVSIFILIPFLDVLKRSTTSAISGAFVGGENYVKIFKNEAFQLAGWNTVRFILSFPRTF